MNFNQFESGINEAPQYSPKRIKVHTDKAETLCQETMMEWKKLQKFVELKSLGGQELDSAEDAYGNLQKAIEAYFDHLKTTP